MIASDPMSMPDVRARHARGANRHSRAPIVSNFDGPLPDPRELPAWMQPDHPKAVTIARNTRMIVSAIAVTLVVMLAWWVAVQVTG